MKCKPKISVIIPVYNAEKYLHECLNSVINQTLRDIEIICINDGSTDSSPEIIAEYAKKDNRIKVISKTNSGYGHTMNVGLDNANGEYIGIVESDDYIKLDMYEKLYDIAKKIDIDFIKADYYMFIGDASERRLSKKTLTRNKHYYNRILYPTNDIFLFNVAKLNSTGIYKRDFIEKYHIRHNESPGASYQDNGFWFQAFCRASRIYLLNQHFYKYRIDNSNSSINNKGKVFIICKEYAFIKDFLNSYPELKSRFIFIFSLKKFHSYLYTYNRIADKYKEIFLKRFSLEFRQALENGELDRSLFTQNEWTTIKNIIDDPEFYYYKKCTEYKSFQFGIIIADITNLIKAFFVCWKEQGLKYTLFATARVIKRVLRIR